MDVRLEIGLLDEYASYRAGRAAAAAAGRLDALYITCGRWPSVEMVEPLETDLGVPVVASNQGGAAGVRRERAGVRLRPPALRGVSPAAACAPSADAAGEPGSLGG